MTVDLFKTSDLEVVAFLLLNDIRPSSRIVEDGRAVLSYDKSEQFNNALVKYMDRCEHCGILFSDLGRIRTKAKRILMDGLDEDKKRGGNR